MQNIPEVKLGLVAVSRDCFPIALSEKRRANIAAACAAKGLPVYECPVAVENERDMLRAVADVKAAGCNALTVFLGNFGPETPETLIAKYFDGPCMFVAAAEGDGDLVNGRGDAYCGMLNCSYNLGLRRLKVYIPAYPVGSAEELADKMAEFVPIARAALGVKDLKIITCHLGNGSSISAIDGGKSVDTSMGFTPLDGLPMGTRSGNIDPAIIEFLAEHEKIDAHQVIDILNKKSGMLGISGVSSDFRDLDAAIAEGNVRAALAKDMFNVSVKKIIGSFIASMGGVDAIVFTAGVGENDRSVRWDVCEHMEYLGIKIDPEKNKFRGRQMDISIDYARVRVLVIPTNEELVIAQDTERLVNEAAAH